MKFASSSGRRVTPAQFRRALNAFEKTGHSNHSTDGLLGAPLIEHCIAQGWPFRLQYYPNGGFFLERLKDEL